MRHELRTLYDLVFKMTSQNLGDAANKQKSLMELPAHIKSHFSRNRIFVYRCRQG
jgi:hypothetical protein